MRRATSAATLSPTPAAMIGAATATSLRDRRNQAASAIWRICSSANQAASPFHSKAVPSSASRPIMRARRALEASTVFSRPSAVGILSAP